MSESHTAPAMCGTVTPPADMHAAARASLSEAGYEELMRQTGGKAPTPRQLCELVEAERAAS